jgi:oligopeptide/dipeptide ABC transporter ATP-binding protein
MYAGRIVEELTADQLASAPLHPYTVALLQAVPTVEHGREGLRAIPGEAPDIASPPPGCAFHPRCPLAEARCTEVVPGLLRREDGRRVACHVVNADLPAVEARPAGTSSAA